MSASGILCIAISRINRKPGTVQNPLADGLPRKMTHDLAIGESTVRVEHFDILHCEFLNRDVCTAQKPGY
jgi:hypothetical protein